MSNTIRVLLGLSFSLAITGCNGLHRETLAPKVASEVTVSKNDPPPGCNLVAYIKGATTFGDLGDAHGELLRTAVLRGGNFVAVDLVERPMIVGLGGYTVRGRLFSCGKQSAPPADMARATPPKTLVPASTIVPPPVVPATEVKSCEPACASGYTCELGACVAVPPTQAGR